MQVELFNRQRAVAFDFTCLESSARRAAFACAPHVGSGITVFDQIKIVEISIVSDRAIAQVHRRFLGVPGPTDVITFEHGEIFVSATTAARQAVLERETIGRELARYIVHGLLHLNGHLDTDPTEAAAMWQVQESVLQSVWTKA